MANEKKTPGDPLLIHARTWNRMVDAANFYADNQRLGMGGATPGTPASQTAIKVRNDSGADRAAGEVLEISDAPLLTVLDPEYLWFIGETPTLTCRTYGVLRQALPDGQIGWLQISGVVRARVNVNDTSHKWARLTSGGHELESGHYGPIHLICNPSEQTGSQDCAVLLGGNPMGEVYVGKLDEALSQGGSASATRWVRNSGGTAFEASDPTITDEVEDWLMKSGDSDISSGKKIMYQRESCSGVLVVIGVECE